MIDYGTPGPNQTYDYSGLVSSQAVYNYIHPNTSSDSILSQADFYISDNASPGSGTQLQYMIQSDSVLGVVGAENMGATPLNIYYQGIYVNLHYPLTYGDHHEDSTDYYVDIPSMGQGYFGLVASEYDVDGYGTLILDDTTVDVIRMTYNNYVTESFNGLSLENYVTQIAYFAENCPSPIVSITQFEQYVNGNFNGAVENLSFSDITNFNVAAGTGELMVNESLNAFPNPTSDHVQFEAKENGTLNVYDINGKLIRTENVNVGMTQINFEHLQKGQYILQLIGGQKVYTKSIIKQ